MKYLGLILSIWIFAKTIGISQQSIELQKDNELSDLFNSYELVIVDIKDITKQITEKSGNTGINLNLELSVKHRWKLELSKNLVITPATKLNLLTADGIIHASEFDLSTYEGKIKGKQESKIRLAIGEGFMSGYINTGKEIFLLEPAKNYNTKSAENAYILYSPENIVSSSAFTCAYDFYKEHVTHQADQLRKTNLKSNCNLLEIAIATDYSIYLDQSSNVNNVQNFFASVFNLIDMDYENLISGNNMEEIDFTIREVMVSSCSDCDPWTTSTDALTVLNDFRLWAEDGGFTENYDLASIWTKRVYDSNVSGLAYQGQVCGQSRYFTGRKFTTDIQSLRIMGSHEIGHTFSAIHNFSIGSTCDLNLGRTPLIMDPVVRPNADGWSNGTQACAVNNLNEVVNTIAGSTCFSGCSATTCDPITNLSINNLSGNGINFSWSGSASSYVVKMKRVGASGYVFNTSTGSNSFNFAGSIESCQQYTVSVQAVCGSSQSQVSSILVSPGFNTFIEIIDVQTSDCIVGPSSSYTLDIFISHGGGNGAGMTIDINGIIKTADFESLQNGIQQLTFTNLPTTGLTNATLNIRASSNSGPFCEANAVFDIPGSDCDLQIRETFDNCIMPPGWTVTTTNAGGFSDPYEWKVGDNTRPIQNYGIALNANTSQTIDGTCMAYFDDDVIVNPQYTGITTLTSPAYDLTQFIDIELSFDYIFHNFEQGKGGTNGSEFRVEIYDGFNWQQAYDDNNDFCPWFNIWTSGCFDLVSLDITSYSNSDFRVRFIYDDGSDGKWTGMVGLDNFVIQGVKGGTVPLELASFEVKKHKGSALLDWSSYNELDLLSYEIQHSEDGTIFKTVGIKEAINDKYNQYQYIHESPAFGQNYYRLEIIDIYKSKEYSDVKSLFLDTHPLIRSHIFPNPVSDIISVEIHGEMSSLQKLEVFDNIGKRIHIIFTKRHSDNQYKVTFQANLSGLENGLYFLRIPTGNTLQTVKFVKN